MLRASISFFIIGLLAYLVGAGNLAGLSKNVGTMLLQIFVVLSVLSFMLSLFTGRAPRIP